MPSRAISAFGPSSCMFESNFPVDKASCSYHVLWNAFKKMVAGASDAEKAAFHAFLQLSDPELVAYLLKREQPSSGAIAGVVTRILSRTQT